MSTQLRDAAVGFGAALLLGGLACGQCAPGLLASSDTPDTAFDVAVSGTRAYVADGGSGLQIFDVSDPSNPAVIGSLVTPGTAFGVAVSGNVVYVADAACGLLVIDVLNPATPVIIGSVDTPDFAQGVAISGTLAYVADQFGGLHIIDVDDPGNASIIGSLVTPNRAMAVAVAGDLAFVADQLTGLAIVDVSDPTNPTLLSTVDSADRAIGVAARGTMAFVAARNVGLQVVDASDPENPVVLGEVAPEDRALGVAVVGTRAYMADADAGLKVIDISDPGNPTIIGAVATPGGDANRLAVQGTEVFIANFAGLRTMNVAPCFDFGACCVDATCIDFVTSVSCTALGGRHLGNDSVCAERSCYNDDCADAITITVGDTPFNTVGATTDGPALPPECDESPADFQNDVWYRYTPLANGSLSISTCDQADFDTRVAVYAGPCEALSLMECRDEGDGVCSLATSLLEVEVIRGEPVLVRVGGNGPFAGTGTLTLTLTECPADSDGDGLVNVVDLLKVITDWGPCP